MKKLLGIIFLSTICVASPIRFEKGGISFSKNSEITDEIQNQPENKEKKMFDNDKTKEIKSEKQEKKYTKMDKSILDDKINLLLKAKKLLGKKYVYGAKVGDPQNFDCSSFVKELYKELGINLPRVSRQQARIGKPISKANLQVGDLIFFNTLGNYISHVGMSIGGNKFVHASSKAGKIIVSDLTGFYLDKASYYVRIK